MIAIEEFKPQQIVRTAKEMKTTKGRAVRPGTRVYVIRCKDGVVHGRLDNRALVEAPVASFEPTSRGRRRADGSPARPRRVHEQRRRLADRRKRPEDASEQMVWLRVPVPASMVQQSKGGVKFAAFAINDEK